jgi:superfamily II DNA or RNA helicase
MPHLIQARASIPCLTPHDEQRESELPQKAVMFCPLPGQVRHVAWWLRLSFAAVVTITMSSEDTAERRTELMNEFQHTSSCAVFVTTTKIGGTGLNLVAANHAVILQKPWVLNEQRQAFGRIVRLGQMRQPHCWLLNTGPSGYDDRVTELHTLRGTAQLLVLDGLMDRPDISTEDLYNLLQSRKEETERASRRLEQGATGTSPVAPDQAN